MMRTSSNRHQHFLDPRRASRTLCNEGCQNILCKSVFEHFLELPDVAALLLTSKSFQNSTFGANFLVNFVVDHNTNDLIDSVLSPPPSCFSLQFAPSLYIKQSATSDPKKTYDSVSNFVSEIVNTKYLRLSLRSLTMDSATSNVISFFFGISTKTWPQLQHLALENCGVNDTVLEIISNNALRCRTLNLSRNVDITDAGLAHVSKLSSITSLNLSYSGMITDAALEKISKLSSITSLDLYSCKMITDAGVEHISDLTSITSLDLSYCDRITDAGVAHLSNLSAVIFLNLSRVNLMTDAGLKHLSKISGITSLILRYCHLITDVGLKHVSNLACITHLDLAKCVKIQDVGLEHLSKLSNLTSLNLSCCSGITVGAKEKHKTAVPKCIFRHG